MPQGQDPFVRTLLGRRDYEMIGALVARDSKVLDLGCGEGDLLEWLAENKNVDARGVELFPEKVQKAIARGVSVYQGNMEECVSDYPDHAFDYIILSQTLQEVRHPQRILQEIMRVGKHAVIAFPNYGHWRVRLSHFFTGRAPKTKLFPHDWYDSPNIHFFTIEDFELLASKESWILEKRIFLAGNQEIRRLPNLMSEVAVYLIRK